MREASNRMLFWRMQAKRRRTRDRKRRMKKGLEASPFPALGFWSVRLTHWTSPDDQYLAPLESTSSRNLWVRIRSIRLNEESREDAMVARTTVPLGRRPMGNYIRWSEFARSEE